MWNGRHPTLSEIREYDRRLLEKQALRVGVKKKGVVMQLKAVLKRRISNFINTLMTPKPKTKKVKHQAVLSIKPNAECCG